MANRKSTVKANPFTSILQEISVNEEMQGNVHINEKSESYPQTNFWTFHRFDVGGENKSLNVVIKSAQTDPQLRKDNNVREYFMNEAHFYSKVVPKIRPILDKWIEEGKMKREIFVPNYFKHSETNDHEWLAIEDVSTEYVKPRDLEDLDKEHLRASIQALAAFHSASLSWKSTNPDEFLQVSRLFSETEMLRSDEDPGKDMKTRKVNAALSAGCRASLSHLTGPYSLSVEKVYNSVFAESPVWVSMEKAEPWSVITHGDCWAKNFLYKYDKSKKITGVAIVDFKCARAASPLLDVSNFLLSSSSSDCLRDLRPFIEEHKDSMMPKMTDYRRHVSLSGPYGLVSALVHHYYGVLYRTLDVEEATNKIANPEETSEGEKMSEKRAALVVKAAHDVRMI